MNILWAVLLAGAAVCALIFNRGALLGDAALTGAARAVETVLSLSAAFAFWSGLLNAVQACGLQQGLEKLLRPALKRLFPAAWGDAQAREAITANLAANMLGVGNAATPAGVAAVKRMKQLTDCGNTATDEMCMFLILNMSAVQLFPATVVALRAQAGSTAPADIALPALLCTLVTTAVGIAAGKALARPRRG